MARQVTNAKRHNSESRGRDVEGACSHAWAVISPDGVRTPWPRQPAEVTVDTPDEFVTDDAIDPSSLGNVDAAMSADEDMSTRNGTERELKLVSTDTTPTSSPTRNETSPRVQLGAVAYAIADEEEIPESRGGFMSDLARKLMDDLAPSVAFSVETCFSAAEAAARHSTYSMILPQYAYICERAAWHYAEVGNRTTIGTLQGAMLALFERSTAPESRFEQFQDFARTFGVMPMDISFRTDEHLSGLRTLIGRSDDSAVGALLAQTAYEAGFAEAYCRLFDDDSNCPAEVLRYWTTTRGELMQDLLIIADAMTRTSLDLDEIKSAMELTGDSWMRLIQGADVL